MRFHAVDRHVVEIKGDFDRFVPLVDPDADARFAGIIKPGLFALDRPLTVMPDDIGLQILLIDPAEAILLALADRALEDSMSIQCAADAPSRIRSP